MTTPRPSTRPASRTALNAVCPYFTMFPLAFPMSVLEDGARPGDLVLDPFCGRGTTVFAARLLGLPAIGIDSNPVAAAIAQAKLVAITPSAIVSEARTVLDTASAPRRVPAGAFWEWAFAPAVLRAICQLREALLANCSSPARIALRGVLLGCLHGPRQQGTPSYLSNQAPRTYAPKPRYSVSFWQRHDLRPADVDVLAVIGRRAERAFGETPPATGGLVVQGDSRLPNPYCSLSMYQPVRWIITSPPYYGMRTYGPDQWLRAWFLGGPPSPDYHQPDQLSHASPAAFSDDLRAVWRQVAAVASPDARLVVRFGGINDRKAEPLPLVMESLNHSGWQVDRVTSAGTAARGRRQAAHFTAAPAPIEEHDIWASRTQ